jgi:hypothetical protein
MPQIHRWYLEGISMDRDKILASDVISPALWCTDQSGTVLTCRTKIPERTPAADVGFAVATVLAF